MNDTTLQIAWMHIPKAHQVKTPARTPIEIPSAVRRPLITRRSPTSPSGAGPLIVVASLPV